MDSESERRSRRILDYLNDGEEHGIEGPAVTPRSSSAAAVAVARSLLPRFRWARLARLGRKGADAVAGGKAVGKGKKVKIAAEKAEHNKPMVASVPAREAADSAVTRPPDVGVGVSLVFLLAKTSDEFNKMVKVRAEMETLLKEIKDQVRCSADGDGDGAGDDDASKPRNLESAASSCLTDGNDRVANVQSEDHTTSSGVEVARNFAKSSSEDGCCVGVDVLEEEFHAELERLHVNYGSDAPPFLPEEQGAELLDDDIAEYRQRFDDDSGEIVEDEEDEDDDHEAEYNGVSARELERRLHELLHQRNQDRIKELEAALRRAQKKLLEKEMEACLWKDTAKLALRQDDESQ